MKACILEMMLYNHFKPYVMIRWITHRFQAACLFRTPMEEARGPPPKSEVGLGVRTDEIAKRGKKVALLPISLLLFLPLSRQLHHLLVPIIFSIAAVSFLSL